MNQRTALQDNCRSPEPKPGARCSRPRFDAHRSAQKTKLARVRLERQLSQRELKLASGIPMRTLQRLEAGQVDNPALAYLVNLSVVLAVPVEDLVEDEWLVFNESLGWEDWQWAGGDPRGRRATLCRHRADLAS